MPDRVGQQLGNYQLLHLLGEGGFAEVYLGEHIHLGTQAAVKVLHMQLARSDIEQFRHEARTVAHLKHQHIVRVLDFGVEGTTPFLVMDYAQGGTLRTLHPKGTRLPMDLVVSYVKQVTSALQYTHERKIVHRDIKPENMLIGEQNEILLSDFGIALIAQSSRYRHTTDMVGTIAYMSPEQIAGHPRTASDQYALGIVVYEWLCGTCPFHGSFIEIAAQHGVTPPPSPRQHLPTLSPEIEQVIMTALAKRPEDRFASVHAFANTLLQASQSSLPRGRARPAGNVTEFLLPTSASEPAAMTTGPDGNLWFTEHNGNRIGRISTSGIITEFPLPTSASKPGGITAGPDGNLWFAEYDGNKIGCISTNGIITEFPLPTSASKIVGTTAGPDGNLWFTEYNGNKIGRISTSGIITEFPLPTSARGPWGITTGPDGNLWFTEYDGNKIGRISTSGIITEFPLPTSASKPGDITAGPDGNLWFTEYNGNKIGRISTSGIITEFPLPTSARGPWGMTAGPDGNLWFTEYDGNKIGRISTSGIITEFPLSTSASKIVGITAGPDGNLWFTEYDGNKIGRITSGK